MYVLKEKIESISPENAHMKHALDYTGRIVVEKAPTMISNWYHREDL